jgi:hypothetical protein
MCSSMVGWARFAPSAFGSVLCALSAVPPACGAPPPGWTGGAPSTCGNGIIDANEYCDGTNVSSQYCEGHGNYVGGTLKCGPDCRTYDFSECIAPGCGDGRTEALEECDPGQAPPSCESASFPLGGTTTCTVNCRLDTSGCKRAICGNGKIEPPEECEGRNLGAFTGKTCGELRPVYTAGVPTCNASCMLDYSPCFPHGCNLILSGLQCW